MAKLDKDKCGKPPFISFHVHVHLNVKIERGDKRRFDLPEFGRGKQVTTL